MSFPRGVAPFHKKPGQRIANKRYNHQEDYEELEKEEFVETVAGKGSYVSGQNNELLREKRLKMMEEKMADIVEESKALGISIDEIEATLKILYEGDEWCGRSDAG